MKAERWSATAWRGSASGQAGRDNGGRENHTLQGRNPTGGRGRRPLGLGGAGPPRIRVGRKEHRTTRGGEEGQHPGLGKLRTHEAGEGSSARPHGGRWGSMKKSGGKKS